MSSIDTLVGQRIKACRQSKKMTQTQLADKIGVTFQQVQKYENGTNRVAAARLWAIAEVFDVPITFFFEGAEGTETGVQERRSAALSDHGAVELMDIYTRLSNDQRVAVLSFLRSVADETQPA